MPLVRKNGITPKNRAVAADSTKIIPSPPSGCAGFLYTVENDDTIRSIAKNFNCSVSQLLKSNPQISSRSGTIFVRQIICIPNIEILPISHLLVIGPRVLFVQLLDGSGNPLPVLNGFTKLASRTFIRVIFNEPVSKVLFFFSPVSKISLWTGNLVGVVNLPVPQRSVRFTWRVPTRIRGSLFIVGCNQSICGPPYEIRVLR